MARKKQIKKPPVPEVNQLKRAGKGTVKVVLYIVFAIFLAAATVTAVVGTRWVLDNKLPAFTNGGIIQITEDDTIDSVVDKVTATLQPLHPKSLRRVLEIERVARKSLHPGAYHILPTHSARYLARAITRGWQTPVTLTISGRILNKETLAGRIAGQMMMDSVTVLKALNDSVLLAKYDTTPQTVFEIILPDSYQLYWDWDMDKVMNRLKKEYDLYWNKERTELAKAQGLTPKEVSTLASIVSEETNRPDEFAKIASVYLTRLHKGMKLQACPTVCYIYNFEIRRVLFRHLENPSPYNTYMYEGLPPGPICLPGKEHIEAVLHPDKHNYLYFCADSQLNGHNIFSETYEEHQRYANEYRKAMDARKMEVNDAPDGI